MRSVPGRTIVLALAVVLVAAGLGGCGGGDLSKANDAIAAANSQIDTYNKLDGEVVKIMDEINALGDTAEEFGKGSGLVDQAIPKIAEQTKAAQAAKAEFVKISSMDVSDDLKTYAKQQEEIADLEAKANGVMVKMLEKTKEMFSGVAAGTLDEAGLAKITAQVDPLQAELDELQKEIQQKQADSEKFFEEKSLGK